MTHRPATSVVKSSIGSALNASAVTDEDLGPQIATTSPVGRHWLSVGMWSWFTMKP
jgi:hypothetical protein